MPMNSLSGGTCDTANRTTCSTLLIGATAIGADNA